MKNEILVYYGKHGNSYFNAQDRNVALKKLFRLLDSMNFYDSYGDEKKELYKQLKRLRVIEKMLNDSDDSENVRKITRTFSAENTEHIKDIDTELKECQEEEQLYLEAKKGNQKALRKFLELRNESEYESWDFETLK